MVNSADIKAILSLAQPIRKVIGLVVFCTERATCKAWVDKACHVELTFHFPMYPKRSRDGFLLVGQGVLLVGIYLLIPSFTLQNNTTLGVMWGVLSGASFLLFFAFLWLASKKCIWYSVQ